MDNHYIVGVMTHGTIESFTYVHKFSEEGTSKVTLQLEYLMVIVLLSLMTQKLHVRSYLLVHP